MGCSEYIEKIQEEETGTRDSISRKLIEKICATINYLISKKIELIPIGSVEVSVLSESEFQSTKIAGQWLLCDGRSCAGSAYHILTGRANTPDLRACFLRGRFGESFYYYSYYSQLSNHEHTGSIPHQTFLTVINDTSIFEYKQHPPSGGYYQWYSNCKTISSVFGIKCFQTGTFETRPENVHVNFFIKVN